MIRSILGLCGIDHRTSTQRVKANTPPEPPEPPLRALPAIRRRLTLPDTEKGQFHSQEQSGLLSRIPTELRLVIWEYALGPEHENDVLHLESEDGTLRSCRCFESDFTKLPFRHYCWKAAFKKEWRDQNIRGHSLEPRPHRKIFPLLLTCRLVYVVLEANTHTTRLTRLRYCETVDILYQCNTLNMRRAESIIRLPKVLLPHRLQRIRHLQIGTAFQCPVRLDVSRARLKYPPDDASKWLGACEVLASLTSLHSLHITIAIWPVDISQRDRNNDESVQVVLEPLKLARAAVFSVTLTEEVTDEVKRRLGAVPFQIIRRERPGIGAYTGAEDD